MDFIPDGKLELAEKLMESLWELCDQRLERLSEEPKTVREVNEQIADAINTLCQAYMIINLIDTKTPQDPQGFVSYSKQGKSE